MVNNGHVCLCALAVLVCNSDRSLGQSTFAIGNSLTYDMRPFLLDGLVRVHIQSGQNLQFIFDNPDDPNIATQTWPNSFLTRQYDWVSVQPYLGTTLDQDVDVISHWMEMQPDANFVIHTGWGIHRELDSAFHDEMNLEKRMRHSAAYFSDLLIELRRRHPERFITSTHALAVLHSIYHDIEDGVGPFSQIDQMYRDHIHLDFNRGRFLAHNLLRRSIEQELSPDIFELTSEESSYLLIKIDSIEAILKKLGDYNADGTFFIDDLNTLSSAIHEGTDDLKFDLNGDGFVDRKDRHQWLHSVKHTSYGDTNLDGEFNSADLVIAMQSGRFENVNQYPATWQDGDWNGDRWFDSADLVLAWQTGTYETQSEPLIVPEPNSYLWIAATCLLAFQRVR